MVEIGIEGSFSFEVSKALADKVGKQIKLVVRRELDEREDELNEMAKRLVLENIEEMVEDEVRKRAKAIVENIAGYQWNNDGQEMRKRLEALFRDEATKETLRLAGEAAARASHG